MKTKNTVIKMAQMVSDGVPEDKIIAALELTVKYAKTIFSSEFFKQLVRIKKKDAKSNTKKN